GQLGAEREAAGAASEDGLEGREGEGRLERLGADSRTRLRRCSSHENDLPPRDLLLDSIRESRLASARCSRSSSSSRSTPSGASGCSASGSTPRVCPTGASGPGTSSSTTSI